MLMAYVRNFKERYIDTADPEGLTAKLALRTMLTCFVGILLFQLLGNISLSSWAAFSVIGCVVPTVGQSLERVKERILGTLGGMIIGILVAHSFGTNLFYIHILILVFIFLAVYLRPFAYRFYAMFNVVLAKTMCD